MILYHGSNVKIATIDLSKSMRGKDFGQGFYLSADRKQAEEMAVFKAMQFDGDPVVTSFEFDERNLNCETLKVKVFEEYNREWAEFVFANRNNRTDAPIHDYDVVYGPIADDKVGTNS